MASSQCVKPIKMSRGHFLEICYLKSAKKRPKYSKCHWPRNDLWSWKTTLKYSFSVQENPNLRFRARKNEQSYFMYDPS